MVRRLLPYEQGHLDGLCGLYSIVNATRFALRTAEFRRPYLSPRPRSLSEAEAELMFLALIRGLIRSPRLFDAFIKGINSRELSILLRLADEWLRKRRAVRLLAKRPLYRCGPIRTKTMLRRISSHLAERGTAVIVGANPPWRHWTVVTHVAGSRLRLFDSCGYASVPLRLGRHSAGFHAGLIKPAEVYLVAIEPAHP
jgi:hypothetical protein